jgi:hypothetical protein
MGERTDKLRLLLATREEGGEIVPDFLPACPKCKERPMVTFARNMAAKLGRDQWLAAHAVSCSLPAVFADTRPGVVAAWKAQNFATGNTGDTDFEKHKL